MPLDLPHLLTERLAHGLPGREAQRRFEPELAFGRHFGPAPEDARAASVMLLLYRHEQAWHLPLVVRLATLAHHAGQVALPGGAVDPGETSQQAALRELEEELGVPESQVRLIGQLSPLYLFVTNFHITPWLGWMPTSPQLQPSAFEVAAVLELPLAALVDRAHHGRHRRHVRGLSFTAPSIDWQGHAIWGATAMLLAEFAALLE